MKMCSNDDYSNGDDNTDNVFSNISFTCNNIHNNMNNIVQYRNIF